MRSHSVKLVRDFRGNLFNAIAGAGVRSHRLRSLFYAIAEDRMRSHRVNFGAADFYAMRS